MLGIMEEEEIEKKSIKTKYTANTHQENTLQVAPIDRLIGYRFFKCKQNYFQYFFLKNFFKNFF